MIITAAFELWRTQVQDPANWEYKNNMTIQTVGAHGAGDLDKVVASLDGFIRALVDYPNEVVIKVSAMSN